MYTVELIIYWELTSKVLGSSACDKYYEASPGLCFFALNLNVFGLCRFHQLFHSNNLQYIVRTSVG